MPSERTTQIIPNNSRYSLMIVMAYLSEKRAADPHYPACDIHALAQSGWMQDNRASWDDTARILEEVYALGHATRDADGCYTITRAGLDWIEVESLIRRSALARDGGAEG